LGHALAAGKPEEDGHMHMVDRIRRWTIGDLYSLPDDGNKYELIRGQLFVTPPPTDANETIGARLHRLLDPYVAANGLGLIYRPRAVVRMPDDTEVEPDLMVRQPQDEPDASWASAPLPILVVEIASDSTRRRDRTQKRHLYAGAGIEQYWIVDGEERTVRVVRPDSEDVTIRESLRWHPVGVAEPLVSPVADIFGPLLRARRVT
jgi:Uma2 family endonuclease